MTQSVTLGNRTLELYQFTGEVIDEKIWSSTQMSGGGGGYNAGSGQSNPVTISSVSATHNQFFLKGDDGTELPVELTNSNVALRKGHRVTVFWAVAQGQTAKWYVAVYNHSTKMPTPLEATIQYLALPPMPTAILVAYVVSFIAICFYGLGIVAMIVLAVTRRNQKKEQLATLRTAVDHLLTECAQGKGVGS